MERKFSKKEKALAMACKEAIDNAISNNYSTETWSLDSIGAVTDACRDYNINVVACIVANDILCRSDKDIRIEGKVRTWAKSKMIENEIQETDRSMLLRAPAGRVNLFCKKLIEKQERMFNALLVGNAPVEEKEVGRNGDGA